MYLFLKEVRMLPLQTYPLNLFDLPVDPRHLSAYNLVVSHQVHLQQVVVHLPQRDVTCKAACGHGQLSHLDGRGGVQLLSGVQHCPKVMVILGGGQ